MTSQTETCEDRIFDQLQSRNADLDRLERIMDRSTNDEEVDEAQDEYHNFALGISTKILVRVELSTGGPADWVEVVCEVQTIRRHESPEYPLGRPLMSLEPETMTYHFADWFDHAERPVAEDSPLWRFVAQMIESGVEL